MAAAMVSIPLSICSLRGCKIPFPNLFDVVLFSLSFLERFWCKKLSKSFSLFSSSSSSSPLLFVVVAVI